MNSRVTLQILLLSIFGSALSLNQEKAHPRNTALVQPEAISLLGKPLHRPAFSAEEKSRLESAYSEAKSLYNSDPANIDHIIWLGRRAAYLWRYQEAIEVFAKGMTQYPNDARLYRHRGHRYITIRQFDRAIQDLRKAAELIQGQPDEIEPDGQPNARNVPTSTLHSNIWYHLGLAYYLAADFDLADEAFRECMKISTNDDMKSATADWLYMTLRRLGRTTQAGEVLQEIHAGMDIIENFSYHKRLMMYKGEIHPDSLLRKGDLNDLDLATQGYGVANWHYYNGRHREARDLFQNIISGSYWAAFGYIAAEAELSRMR